MQISSIKSEIDPEYTIDNQFQNPLVEHTARREQRNSIAQTKYIWHSHIEGALPSMYSKELGCFRNSTGAV